MRRLFAGAAIALAVLVTSISPVQASMPGLSFTETGCDGYSDSVARLYTAGLGREPEQGGFDFWMGQYTTGVMGLEAMSVFFVGSDEFQSKYGNLDRDGFLNQIYLNVLNRPADTGGLLYWGDRMAGGMTRGDVLLSFAESPENVTRSGTAEPTLGPYNLGQIGAWACQPTVATQPGDGPVSGEPLPDGNPGNSHNCSDFMSQADSQRWFDFYFPLYGDVSNLDADGDGIPCEGLD